MLDLSVIYKFIVLFMMQTKANQNSWHMKNNASEIRKKALIEELQFFSILFIVDILKCFI